MNRNPLYLTIRGVRGSAPSPGASTVRYGGHTPCMDLAFTPVYRLILDCGSGLRALHADLPEDPGPEGFRFEVFMTHYHMDHLEGLRFFRPLFDKRSRFTFHGFPWSEMGVQAALEGSMAPPWFPVRLQDTASAKSFVDLSGSSLWMEDVEITSARIHHPQGAAAYRLDRGGRSVVLVTDNEPGDPEVESVVHDLARGADVLIHDAQYTPEEYERHYRGWGHSSWKQAVETARRAGVKRLILFHHDPDRTDEELGSIVEEARREFPALDAAWEGISFPL